jgi:biopolymer transport protein TolQ
VGLFVAIPATCGYNTFRARLTTIEGICITFAGQLLNRMQHEAAGHKDGLSFAGER